MNITEFLEARLAEDEVLIRHAPRGDEAFDIKMVPVTPELRSRLLAECAAKRAIIKEHAEEMTHWWPEMVEVQVCGTCGDGASVEWPCPTIAVLSTVYADHADYRQEWKP